ncbi:putative 60S acidic ribosomal protein P2 [Spironucleus salmonicida]|uniref:60S acidic ribosomal protein P2 n=1 Tax=Spironucleus salmonicida TaxID=348837 RepID=V6LLG8_9EUKA|nr:putative 60S acidic ribosomal protein P2 [Spironucleus salmonicida]|eukprot:EST45505.1 Putative 60S acidic ribosomal protein P2 [Spironucleus salmonicida]
MKNLAAYLLCTLAGKDAPTAADVSAILKSVEIEAVEADIKNVIASIAAKECPLSEIMEAGKKRMAALPSGAAAPAAAAGAASSAEEKKEKTEEEEMVGGFCMDDSSSEDESD